MEENPANELDVFIVSEKTLIDALVLYLESACLLPNATTSSICASRVNPETHCLRCNGQEPMEGSSDLSTAAHTPKQLKS